jgi:hypothetical protein
MSEERFLQEWLSGSGCEELFEFPDELLRQQWQPTKADRNAAWSFYTEIRTLGYHLVREISGE